MSAIQVLLVAGTHGNEINAPWIFNQWKDKLDLIDTYELNVVPVIGNPLALEQGKRYIDRDLNRSFENSLLDSPLKDNCEISRAKELLAEFGPKGENPCQILIDFHSTTSFMGTSLVVYGRRHADLALASLIQNRLGLPIYLYEGDSSQKGFMVESWPCGLVVEVGPVPQGLLHSKIINQTLLVLRYCLKEISAFNNSLASFPDKLIIHRHLRDIDFPRDSLGHPKAYIHPAIQGKDWHPITNGHKLFKTLEGKNITFSANSGEDNVVPVFINEAAYSEKNIAMSITKREVWTFNADWITSLKNIVLNY